MSQVSTDPIADMLTRIRNAISLNRHEISLPHSNLKQALAHILVETGFVAKVDTSGEGKDKRLILTLAGIGQNSKITEIERLSKPGRRTYTKAKEIPTIKQGRGVVIVSTSKGMMSGDRAKREQIGGELICKVY